MELAVLADALAPVLRELVDATTAPILRRLDALEATFGKELPALQTLRGEVDALPARFERQVADAIGAAAWVDADAVGRINDRCGALEKRLDEMPAAASATDVATLASCNNQVREMVIALQDPDGLTAMVEKAVAALPKAPTAEEVAALVPAPEPGKDATPEQIAETVEKVLATWERPKDGESVTVEQLQPVIDTAVEKAVAGLPPPKDGVGLADALQDHEGVLVLTTTDGKSVKVGKVKGDPGKDGLDGLGFEDMTEELADDGRTIIRRYSRGDQVKEFRFALSVVLDRGVFKDGTEYTAGDGTTSGGSFWIAQGTTKDKPGTSDAWRLAVKKGRDGKDGRDLGPPPKSPPVKL